MSGTQSSGPMSADSSGYWNGLSVATSAKRVLRPERMTRAGNESPLIKLVADGDRSVLVGETM